VRAHKFSGPQRIVPAGAENGELAHAFILETQKLEAELDRLRRENLELKSARGSMSSGRSAGSSDNSAGPKQKAPIPQLDFSKLNNQLNTSQTLPKITNGISAHILPGVEGQQQLSVFNCNLSPVVLNGGYLWKIPSSGNKPKRRWFQLKPCISASGSHQTVAVCSGKDCVHWPLTLVWREQGKHTSTSQESKRSLLLADVQEVRRGHSTQTFHNMIADYGALDVPLVEVCLSLCFGRHHSLDLAAENEEEAELWFHGILALVQALQSVGKQQKSHREPPSPSQKVSTTVSPVTSHDSGSANGSEFGFLTNRSTDLAPITYRASESHKWRYEVFNAVKENSVEAVARLFDQGCPVDIMEKGTGDTPMLAAARLGYIDIVHCCLERGARNDPHPSFGLTALQAAVNAGKADVVQLILEVAAPSKADQVIVNHEDPNKEAPLHVSCRYGNTEIVELLLMHGANLSLVDGNGWTCLHSVCKGGHAETLAFLLDAGADVFLEEKDSGWNRPLHIAAENGKYNCVKLLLETAASVRPPNSAGLTPFQLAQAKGHYKVTKLLQEYDPRAMQPEGPPVPVQKLLRGEDPGSPNYNSMSTGAFFQDTSDSLPRPRTSSTNSNFAEGYSVVHRASATNSDGTGTSKPGTGRLFSLSTVRHESGLFQGLDVVSLEQAPGTLTDQTPYSYQGKAGIQLPLWQNQTTAAEGGLPQGLNTARDALRAMHYRTNTQPAVETSQTYDGLDSTNYQAPPAEIDEAQYYNYEGTEAESQAYWQAEEFYVNEKHWQMYYTAEGYPYYIDVETGISQWEDPRQHSHQEHSGDPVLAGPADCSETSTSEKSSVWGDPVAEPSRATGISRGRLLMKNQKAKGMENSGSRTPKDQRSVSPKRCPPSSQETNMSLADVDSRADQFESPRSQATPGKEAVSNGRPSLTSEPVGFSVEASSPMPKRSESFILRDSPITTMKDLDYAESSKEEAPPMKNRSESFILRNSPIVTVKDLEYAQRSTFQEDTENSPMNNHRSTSFILKNSPITTVKALNYSESPATSSEEAADSPVKSAQSKSSPGKHDSPKHQLESNSSKQGRQAKKQCAESPKKKSSPQQLPSLSRTGKPTSTNTLHELGSSTESLYYEASGPTRHLGLQLSDERIKQIEIGLQRLKCKFATWMDLCTAVVEQNERLLGFEELRALGPITPSTEELKHAANFKNQDLTDVVEAEAFIVSAAQYPRFPRKVDAFMFRAGYLLHVEALNNKLDSIESACTQIKTDTKISQILKTACESNNKELNTMNFARLEKLDQLEKLSASGEILGSVLAGVQPDVKAAFFSLPEDFSKINAAANIKTQEVFSEVNSTFEHLQKMKRELQRETKDLREEAKTGFSESMRSSREKFRTKMASFIEKAEIDGGNLCLRSNKIAAEIEDTGYVNKTNLNESRDSVFIIFSKFVLAIESLRTVEKSSSAGNVGLFS